MRGMLVVHSPAHRRHTYEIEIQHGQPVPALEVPARADAIHDALAASGRHALVGPRAFGMAPIEAVHDPAMLRYLATCWEEWVASGRTHPIVPETVLLHTYRDGMGPVREPVTPAGRIGYWCFDTESPIVEGTWPATLEAADVALTAAQAVLDGAAAAYGLCRPPGHHAARRMFGGYCYVNNAAIVAEWLAAQGAGRVGILDVDYHHGNGTQQVFWERPDVPYASLHADPDRAYPYFSGHADETGGGAGAGATLNIPLPARTGDDAYLAELERALDWLDGRADDVLVVSLGIDTYERDLLGDLSLTTEGYRRCGELVARSGRRLVILQEGGYYIPALGANVAAWLDGVESIAG
jgi:acetoin utilization deacetylase AcuC-like enzyme